MRVSFESKEERDAVAARALTPVTVERSKSEMQARRSLLIRMLASTKKHQRYADIKPRITTHPFQISVDEVMAMHIRQTLGDIHKLNASAKAAWPKQCIYIQARRGSRRDSSE